MVNGAVSPVAARKARRRLTREEAASLTREAIFAAATRVVGEVGYANASIARITEDAGIAQGTFYLYFENRQSLFDELLPHARREMLELVRSRVSGAGDFFETEERGMRAFLDYLRTNPGFFRILDEAETVAPESYRRHYEDVGNRYVRLLEKARDAGHVRVLADDEIRTASYLMMGARISLYRLCGRLQGKPRVSPDEAVAHYMTMVRTWLAPARDGVRGRRPAQRRSKAVA